MANYNKSFNFKNGVQVDTNNFIVNPNGLVGIGTSIPTEILDVYGTAKITGLVTTTNLAVSGVSTFYNDVKIGSAITAVASTGVLYATQFVGSAAGLTGIVAISTNGWIVNAGTLSTASKVGIGTSFPYYSLQVGNDPLTGNGFSVDALSGNVNTTGILTAVSLKTIGSITGYNFSGFGTNITGINATNISNGTLSNSRLPSVINIAGSITGYSFSGFGTDITGINATNISNGTLNNSRLPTDLNISGIITANSGVITSLTAGIASITQLYVSGVTTSVQGFIGNLVGIASTALSLSGSPSITVANINSTNIDNTGIITSSNLHIGTAGVNFTALSSGKVGIGTTNPTSELQIRKSGQSLLEVISDTSSAIISIGQSVGVGKSTGTLQYNAKNVEISNNDTGNLDFYIHRGAPGISTGNFRWIYGQGNSQKLTLTYEGKLGIGIDIPTSDLHVVGTSTVTSNAYFGNHIYVKENIYFKSLKDGVVETNTNVTNGISTFSTLYLYGGNNVLGIGTNDAGAYKFKIEDNSPAYLGNDVGIGTTNANDPVFTSQTLFKVFGNSYLRSANIGTSISIGSGIVTASSFVGSASGLYSIPAGNLIGTLPPIDGSSLTGIVGSGSGVIVKDSGTVVGTAGTIDFGDNLTVSAISAGIVTVTGSASGGGVSQFVTTAAGIHTLSNVGIGTTNPTSTLTVSGDVKVTGIITASSFSGNASSATYATSAGIATYATSAGIATYATSAGISTYATSAGIATYATNAGIATYATSAGIATYATSAGIATYATSAGIATYATSAGIATYATSAGIATYATNAGIATSAQGLTGTPNLNVGVVTATLFVGNGSGLTNLIGVGAGIVVKDSGTTVGTAGTIDFGDNLTVSAISAGIVTVTGSASGSSSQFVTTAAGIHTLSNVGIGTTNPTSKLTITGNALVTGVVTATTFVGALTGTASNVTTNANLTGDVTSNGNATSIASGVIVNDDINASAAISLSKLSTSGTLTATTFVGSLTGTATSTTNIPNLTGDITSTGTTTAIAAGVIVNADINASAGIVDTKLDTISTAGKVSNSATTATSANTNSTIVARDGSGNFSAGTITANLTGTASNVTTNANLTGDITSTGNATAIATGVIVNADINASAGIVDTKLATISTAGKVSNSATTATNANTASAIVARDGSGNFSAGTITATTFSGSGSGLTNIPASSITFTISASDSSNYTFSGPGIVSGNTLDPVLYLYKGFTYTFINTTGASHPFAIRVSSGGSSYTPGVSGSTTGTQTFIVPMNAPSTLYYQCTIHGSMGNTINII